MFRLMLGGLTPEEDSIVDRAISETYAIKDITPGSDFSKVEPPLLSDFEMVLSSMDGAESILTRLSKYTKGTWSTFINQPSNVDINRKFIVFSVRDMEDELKPVAMYIVTHFIWNAIRKNLKKRLLVVDEAWWMMKSDDTASFLYSIAKRGRKYYLGLATITQDVDDFMRSPYGVPIVTNSSIQLLMKQSPSSVELLQKTFNLTDEEKYLLLESGVGEGIFFAGLKHVAIKVIASYTEEQIITSDPSQILAIQKAKKDFAESEEAQQSQLSNEIREAIPENSLNSGVFDTKEEIPEIKTEVTPEIIEQKAEPIIVEKEKVVLNNDVSPDPRRAFIVGDRLEQKKAELDQVLESLEEEFDKLS